MNTLVRKGTVRCVHLIKHALCCPGSEQKYTRPDFSAVLQLIRYLIIIPIDREASIVLVIEYLPEMSASISRGS